MKNQVTVQDLMRAFRGMFPMEIHKLLTTHEKYFGFRIEGNRTKFVLNSAPSEGKYRKAFVGQELLQLAKGFLKYKLCEYDCSQIAETAQSKAAREAGVSDEYMLEHCTPKWMTIDQTLNLFNSTKELYWVLRYRKFKYRWCSFDEDGVFVEENACPDSSEDVIICEFPHTQAVLTNLINECKIKKPFDPEKDAC